MFKSEMDFSTWRQKQNPARVRRCLLFFAWVTLASAAEERPARFLVLGEAYGQGLWYSGKVGYRFHEKLLLTTGYSYLEVPPTTAAGATARFHIIPVGLSGLWQLPFTSWPIHAEFMIGGNINFGSDRIDRTGVRATMAGQNFTPIIAFGVAFFPREGGLVIRATGYMFQGIDNQGLESRRLPWLGGSLGFAF